MSNPLFDPNDPLVSSQDLITSAADRRQRIVAHVIESTGNLCPLMGQLGARENLEDPLPDDFLTMRSSGLC
jgi:hypothetical protein